MTIELHTWNTPNGRKISVALEEMGLPYKVFPINITKGEQMAAGFLAISPNNKIPAIVDPSASAYSNPARSCSISARRPGNSCRFH
jgi:GST-like protein